MSDGGGESSSKSYEDRGKSKGRGGGEDFARGIARIAVAQIFESAGFYGIHELARDTLSDVAVRYIREVGKLGNFYANLSGRTDSNALDVVQSLEDLGLVQGFSGASDLGHSSADSGVVRDIAQYVNEEGENPFVYAIPKFPIFRDPTSGASFAQVGDSPPDEHIPAWLPVFPEPQTYAQERQLNYLTKGIEPFVEQSGVDNFTVNNLHQQMSCNRSKTPIDVEGGDAAGVKQEVQNNPFLAPPLRFGEKEVASVVIPPKLLDGTAMRESEDHVPVFEMLNSVAQPMKSPLNDTKEVKEKVSPSTRPTVQFKLKSSKKSLRKPLSVKIDDIEQMTSLFEVDNNKQGNKRRAEQIMKESVDNVEESASVRIEDSAHVNSSLEVDNDKDERKREVEQIIPEPMDIVEESASIHLEDSAHVNSSLEVNNDKDERKRDVEQIIKEPMNIVEESVGVNTDESEQMNSMCEVNNDKDERKRIAEQIMKDSMDIVEESAKM